MGNPGESQLGPVEVGTLAVVESEHALDHLSQKVLWVDRNGGALDGALRN